jgi:hypothetical protein
MFKPQSNMTIYTTWANSLQAGDLAPAGTVNAGTSLAPYRSTEWEAGYKVSLAKIDFTAAVFRIDRHSPTLWPWAPTKYSKSPAIRSIKAWNSLRSAM